MIRVIEKKFSASSIDVNYAEGPDNGPPMVLIHGLGGQWANWESIIGAFSKRWHIYAIELRGHGDSGRVTGKYGFDDYPMEVVEFLQNVISRPAYVVGHSLGGVTAAGVCARAPELIAAAVLEDPPLYIREWFDESNFAPMFQSILDIRNKNLDEQETATELRKIDQASSDQAILMRAKAVMKADPGIWAAALDGRISESWKPDDILVEAKSPVLLIQANPDLGGALRDAEATRAIDLLEQGRYVRWDDSGHGVHNEFPDRFVQLVNAFFGQVRRQLSEKN